MCGRYVTLSDTHSWKKIHGLLKVPAIVPFETEREIAYPGTEQRIVMLEDGELTWSSSRWGWYKNKAKETGAQYNTRFETLETYYPELAENQRALVPMEGFIEGQASDLGDHLFRPEGVEIGLAAAIWKRLPNGEDAGFSILTRAARELMRPYHHRQPLLLTLEEAERWMSADWRDAVEQPFPSFLPEKWAA